MVIAPATTKSPGLDVLGSFLRLVEGQTVATPALPVGPEEVGKSAVKLVLVLQRSSQDVWLNDQLFWQVIVITILCGPVIDGAELVTHFDRVADSRVHEGLGQCNGLAHWRTLSQLRGDASGERIPGSVDPVRGMVGLTEPEVVAVGQEDQVPDSGLVGQGVTALSNDVFGPHALHLLRSGDHVRVTSDGHFGDLLDFKEVRRQDGRQREKLGAQGLEGTLFQKLVAVLGHDHGVDYQGTEVVCLVVLDHVFDQLGVGQHPGLGRSNLVVVR